MSTACRLPSALKSFCEMGCIYRESTHRHLACRIARRIDCAAPCRPRAKMDVASNGEPVYTYYHEVCSVQDEACCRDVRVRMREDVLR